MATLQELVDSHGLVALGGGLEPEEQPIRLLYAFPHVIGWLSETLPGLEPLFDEGRQSPMQQMDDLLHDFVAGEDLSYYERSHSMQPEDQGIWEIKTPDIRLFGWFRSRGVLLIGNIDTAFKCKEHDLYAGYRNDTVRRRDALDLDAPKFMIGGWDDVL